MLAGSPVGPFSSSEVSLLPLHLSCNCLGLIFTLFASIFMKRGGKHSEVQVSELMKIRRSKGLSQRALAKSSGVSPSSIYEVENGRRKANPSTLRKLADALGVEVVDLLEVQERPKVPRIFSAEWALKVSHEEMQREIKTADTAQLHKLLAELVGDDSPQAIQDLRAKRSPAIPQEAFSRALEVRAVLIERGEHAPESRLPVFRARLEALHLA